MFTIENKTTGIILGTFKAETKAEALQQLAVEAGYNSVDDIPNFKPNDLLDYES